MSNARTLADSSDEWLEADGLGGFASGTVNLIRTRRYHGILLTATTPPTGRVMLVNGFEARLETPSGRVDLTAQRYLGDVVHPHGHERIQSFTHEPWPTWTYDVGEGRNLRFELLAVHSQPATILRWSMDGDTTGVTLHVRPLISGRDYHSLQRETHTLSFSTTTNHGRLEWQPYPDRPAIISHTSGAWEHSPTWYRDFLYTAERERGLDDVEDLASPGVLHFVLSDGPAVWILGTENPPALADVDHVFTSERQRRAGFSSPLDRAADAYLVARGAGQTIVAGYPWFTDWGRDTFIAIRGLCLATGRLATARDVLLEWASTVSEGMLPNRFPDMGDAPEYNAVDASLWFVIAAGELLTHTSTDGAVLTPFDRRRLEHAVNAVLDGLARGTRYGIRCDRDGLLACGTAGVQLTWMDARVGERVITPRIGKPVEIQALWINALRFGAGISHRWTNVAGRALRSFEQRFWNETDSCLYDVVDVDHIRGTADASIRPNQVFAVGGLATRVLTGDRARRVVDTLEAQLLVPLGLRTLDPASRQYVGKYEGNSSMRDAAYHQGTAWPWLMGAFVDAWLAVRGDSSAARTEAAARFLPPFHRHLGEAGLGHVSEIVDAEPPFTPRGCPFQAWSVGEFLRLQQRLTYT